MKELLTPEIVAYSKELAWLASIIAPAIMMAFNKEQREYILKRDKHKCQFPEEHKCNGDDKLEVHHIIPQRYAKTVLKINPDYEDNGITLCEHSHQTKVHPDMLKAKQTYAHGKREGRNTYGEIMVKRDELLKERKIYWNDKWDRLFHAIVQKNKQRFERENKN